MINIQLLDTVALLEDINADDVKLTRGEVRAVVETLASDVCKLSSAMIKVARNLTLDKR